MRLLTAHINTACLMIERKVFASTEDAIAASTAHTTREKNSIRNTRCNWSDFFPSLHSKNWLNFLWSSLRSTSSWSLTPFNSEIIWILEIFERKTNRILTKKIIVLVQRLFKKLVQIGRWTIEPYFCMQCTRFASDIFLSSTTYFHLLNWFPVKRRRFVSFSFWLRN